MNKTLFNIFLLSISIISACAGSKKETATSSGINELSPSAKIVNTFKGQVESQKNEGTPQCSTDTGCTAINVSCCGCQNGGQQKAVSITVAEQEQASIAADCAEMMCALVMSEHPSCKQKAVCENSLCVLR